MTTGAVCGVLLLVVLGSTNVLGQEISVDAPTALTNFGGKAQNVDKVDRALRKVVVLGFTFAKGTPDFGGGYNSFFEHVKQNWNTDKISAHVGDLNAFVTYDAGQIDEEVKKLRKEFAKQLEKHTEAAISEEVASRFDKLQAAVAKERLKDIEDLKKDVHRLTARVAELQKQLETHLAGK